MSLPKRPVVHGLSAQNLRIHYLSTPDCSWEVRVRLSKPILRPGSIPGDCDSCDCNSSQVTLKCSHSWVLTGGLQALNTTPDLWPLFPPLRPTLWSYSTDLWVHKAHSCFVLLFPLPSIVFPIPAWMTFPLSRSLLKCLLNEALTQVTEGWISRPTPVQPPYSLSRLIFCHRLYWHLTSHIFYSLCEFHEGRNFYEFFLVLYS